ncbi:LptF/LptG family permease [Haloferula sargassicola]|uniref:YjgP/YjgQ family permease n=1 Tax=Haloferula sargassicola TaxID=490096 RepID=A0ABP9UM92_9BACT
MRISDRYIGRHILSGTLFAIILLSLLLVMGNVFKQIRPLLVEYGAPLSVLGDFTLRVLPVSLIYTIPWGFLSAVLLVFGRLSSDNELNGFRAAGVSLTRLAAPVLAIGLGLSMVCLWLNLGVAPAATKTSKDVIRDALIKDPRVLLRAGRDQSRLKNLRVFSESDNGEVFQNFHVFLGGDASTGAGEGYIHADTATTVNDVEKQEIRLRFTNAYTEATYSDAETKGTGKTKDFTLMSKALEWMVINYGDDARQNKLNPSSMSNTQLAAMAEHYRSGPLAADASKEERRRDKIRQVVRSNLLAEMTRRYTSSFACLAFAFIGVPLGIKARRRDTSSGLILSLAIGGLYFLGGSMLKPDGDSTWLLWIPNMVCVALGIFLFRRARFR